MKLLEAINLILPKLGEHPVTSITTKHPTLAVVIPIIENEVKELLLRGWWFNEFKYTAYPDSEGAISLGTDTLAFTPDCANVAVRGLRLFNTDTLSYTFSTSVPGVVKLNVPFEELPESAAQYIQWKALVTALTTDIGITQEVQLWSMNQDKANGELLAEHLRNRKYNTRRTKQFAKLRRALNA